MCQGCSSQLGHIGMGTRGDEMLYRYRIGIVSLIKQNLEEGTIIYLEHIGGLLRSPHAKFLDVPRNEHLTRDTHVGQTDAFIREGGSHPSCAGQACSSPS